MRRCTKAGCESKHYGRDLCLKHYGEWYRSQHRKIVRVVDDSADGWMPAAKFPAYEVHESGLVRNGRHWLLRASPDGDGRLQLGLYRDGKQHPVRVHRLVLESFAGPCPADKDECCHWDGDVQNNSIENLFWGTKSENQLDRVRHGTHHFARLTECVRGHAFTEGSYRLYKNRRICKACEVIRSAECHTRRIAA